MERVLTHSRGACVDDISPEGFDLNAWGNATFLVVSGTIAVIRTANLVWFLYLVLRKMLFITSTSPVPE